MVIGRSEELARIDRLLASARLGTSDALVITGEPGIGKTALLDEAAALAAGTRVLRATGYASERDIPYAGLHALLGPVLDLRDRIPAVQGRALGTALALVNGTFDVRSSPGAGTELRATIPRG